MPKTFIVPFFILGAAGLIGLTLEPAQATAADRPAVTTRTGGVQLVAALEQEKLVADRSGQAWLRIAATAEERSGPAKRLPVDLTLVIDRSGSMSGQKMNEARRAALAALDRLNNGDRVTVISFDNGAVVHGANQRVGIDSLAAVRSAISGLRGRGATDMDAGLSVAAETIAQVDHHSRTSRLLLLSDGHPNRENGLDDKARALSRSGTITTTLGLGRDYNEDLMAKIANAGLGSYYFVDVGQDLGAVFAQELDAAAAVVGREAVAHVRLHGGATLDRVLGFEHSTEQGVVQIPIGDIYAGRTVDVLTRLQHPAFQGADVQIADVTLTFIDESGTRLSLAQPIGAALVKDERVAAASAVPHVVEKAEKARTAFAYLDANDAFNSGNEAEGERILKKQLDRLEQQSQALGSAALRSEAGQLKQYQLENKKTDRKAMNNKLKWKARHLNRGY